MQANNFLELFSIQWNTCVWSSHIGIQTKDENSQNAPNSIFDLQDKSFICTKFQAFTMFRADSTCIRGGAIPDTTCLVMKFGETSNKHLAIKLHSQCGTCKRASHFTCLCLSLYSGNERLQNNLTVLLLLPVSQNFQVLKLTMAYISLHKNTNKGKASKLIYETNSNNTGVPSVFDLP